MACTILGVIGLTDDVPFTGPLIIGVNPLTSPVLLIVDGDPNDNAFAVTGNTGPAVPNGSIAIRRNGVSASTFFYVKTGTFSWTGK